VYLHCNPGYVIPYVGNLTEENFLSCSYFPLEYEYYKYVENRNQQFSGDDVMIYVTDADVASFP
jgi:hypothetical protein